MREDTPYYLFIITVALLVCYVIFRSLLYGQMNVYNRANNWIELDNKYLIYYSENEKPNYIINIYDISYIDYGVEKKDSIWFIVIYLTRGKTFRYEYDNYYIYEREMVKLLGENR